MTLTTAYNADAAPTIAARFWQGNILSLSRNQPLVAGLITPPERHPHWCLGRDGSLTGRWADGQWIGGCSVPTAAARAMLSTLTSNDQPALFLEPTWAAHLVEALNRVKPQQPVLAIVNRVQDLWLMLHCHDFSAALESGRLWLLTGQTWQADFQKLLETHEALPTPSIFIRTNASDEALTNQLMADARSVLQAEGIRRQQQMTLLIQQLPTAPVDTLCRLVVAGPMQFRLWDDASRMLAGHLIPDIVSPRGTSIHSSAEPAEVAQGTHHAIVAGAQPVAIELYDTDQPASSSTLGLARAISRSDAILTAGTGRSDLPAVAPLHKPWMTWVTTARIPSPVFGAAQDRLLLADEQWRSKAKAAGWQDSQLSVIGWPAVAKSPAMETEAAVEEHAAGVKEPVIPIPSQAPVSPDAPALHSLASPDAHGTAGLNLPALVMIVDLPESMESPDFSLSSHTLLWEAIGHEIGQDPFVVGDDPVQYLHRRREGRRVAAEGLDLGRFVEGLILPGYAVGLARLLVAANIPLRLHGKNWSRLKDLAPYWFGPIEKAEDLQRAVDSAAALVHCWPVAGSHSIENRGKAVLRATGRRGETFVREARELLASIASGKAPSLPQRRFTGRELIDQLAGIVRQIQAAAAL